MNILYIPEFWVGVIVTLAVEITAVLIAAIVKSLKRGDNHNDQ